MKKVEIDVDRDDINKADLAGKDKMKSGNKEVRNNKNKKASKGRRSYSKDGRRRDHQIKSKRNDPRFYRASDALTAGSARFIYDWPLGNKLEYGFKPGVYNYTNNSIPGVMSIEYVPTIGVSTGWDSPVNVAGRKMYAYLQSIVSMTIQPDPADLMLYILSSDTLITWHKMLVRAYRTLNLNSVVNKYTPRVFLRAQGFDFDDLNANKAEFFFFINSLAFKLSQYNFPKGYTFQERHEWMVEGMYIDSEITRPQTYIFKPYNLYKYHSINESGSGGASTASYLEAYAIPAGMTFAKIKEITDALLMDFSTDQDIWNMSALYERGFGMENMHKFEMIGADEVIIPVYRQEVLDQINNMSIFGIPSNVTTGYADSWNITQSVDVSGVKSGALLQRLFRTIVVDKGSGAFSSTGPVYAADMARNLFLNFNRTGITEDDVLEATRFSFILGDSTIDPDPTIGYECSPDHYGSEVVVAATIYYLQYDGITSGEKIPQIRALAFISQNDPVLTTKDASQPLSSWNAMAYPAAFYLSSFDYHFRYSAYAAQHLGNGKFALQFMGDDRDYANYTILSKVDVDKLHINALLAEFTNQKILGYGDKPVYNR